MVKLKFVLEDFLINEWEEVRKSFPKLEELAFVNDTWQANGQIDVIDPSGILWKTFFVRVQIPSKYPLIPPIIFETGGVLPIDPEWHINGDGSCCVGPYVKVYQKLNNVLTIKRWFDLIVMPYFFDQVHRIENGEYKGKEHAHGTNGLLNNYQELWKLGSYEKVIYKLKLITGVTKFPRNAKCFCGNNLKYKKCHLRAKNFDGIPIEVYKEDLRMILRTNNLMR